MISELPQGREQFVVLRAGSDGDTQAVLAELYTATVANDDAFVYEVVVDFLSICDTCEEEVVGNTCSQRGNS